MTTFNVNQTINAYNINAEKYARKFDSFATYKRKISDFQNKHITNGSQVLDLGCGPGNNIRTILENDDTCFFTGIDLSSKFISIAKERFPQFNFQQQDIRNIDLHSKFDIVIASFCIVHLTDDETEEFIKNVAKLITYNGFIYLSYMSGEGSGFESTSFSKEQIFFNYYTDEFVIKLLHQNNLTVLEISKEKYTEPDGSITKDTFIYANNKNIT